jgi:hypothetical protein
MRANKLQAGTLTCLTLLHAAAMGHAPVLVDTPLIAICPVFVIVHGFQVPAVAGLWNPYTLGPVTVQAPPQIPACVNLCHTHLGMFENMFVLCQIRLNFCFA